MNEENFTLCGQCEHLLDENEKQHQALKHLQLSYDRRIEEKHSLYIENERRGKVILENSDITEKNIFLKKEIAELKETIIDREGLAFRCIMGAENKKIEIRKLEKEIAELKFSNEDLIKETKKLWNENNKLKDTTETIVNQSIDQAIELDNQIDGRGCIIRSQAEIIKNLRIIAGRKKI